MLNGKREAAWFRLLHAILLIIFVASLVQNSDSRITPVPGYFLPGTSTYFIAVTIIPNFSLFS